PRTQRNVLGRRDSGAPGAQAIRAAPQRLCRPATLRLALVGGYRFELENPGGAGNERNQCRAVRNSLLGNGYGRLHSYARTYARALRALVSVQLLLLALPFARPRLEAALTLGMGRGNTGSTGGRRSAGRLACAAGPPQRAGRAHLPEVPRTSLQDATLHLLLRRADAPYRSAADARAMDRLAA